MLNKFVRLRSGKNTLEVVKVQKVCIECNAKPARYWGSSFCEDCFRKLLKEKLEEEDKSNGQSKSDSD